VRHTALVRRVGCLSLVLWTALSGQDVPVTTLKQTGLFALPNNPSRISGIASGGGVLWFLVRNGNWSELLATDVAGGNPTQFAVQPPAKNGSSLTGAICASPDGRIAVGRDGSVEVYQRGGALLETIPVPAYNCVLDQELRVTSGTGVDFLNAAGVEAHVALPQLPKYAQVNLLGLADRRLGLLDSFEGVLYTLDQQTGNWMHHSLAAPEFQAIRNLRAQGEEILPIPFVMSPSVAGGEFYVLSNPTNRKQGAKILRFDSQGNLLARYRCPLPTSVAPPTGTNPNGYLIPSSVVVMDRTLLLVSSPQKVVASYSLD
jgi:hypothetical protein